MSNPHRALEPAATVPERNGDEQPEPGESDGGGYWGNFYWRIGRQATALSVILGLCLWMFSEFTGIMRHLLNNQTAQHAEMVESNKAIERHVATQIEVTRELSATVKESTFVMRANLAATERLELVLKLFGWPLGAGKKEEE